MRIRKMRKDKEQRDQALDLRPTSKLLGNLLIKFVQIKEN